MTPFLNPPTQAEENFNMPLCATQVLIEQTFGILKRRFACLHNELRTSPEQAIVYITACAVLHNLGIEKGEIMNLDPLDRFEEHKGPLNDVIVRQDGSSTRKHLVIVWGKVAHDYWHHIIRSVRFPKTQCQWNLYSCGAEYAAGIAAPSQCATPVVLRIGIVRGQWLEDTQIDRVLTPSSKWTPINRCQFILYPTANFSRL